MTRLAPLDSLTAILHLGPNAPDIERDLIDWRATIGLARRHLLGPALWPALVEKKIVTPLPPALRDFLGERRTGGGGRHYLLALEEDHRANIVRNAAIRDQARAIIVALNAGGIEPGALKGARVILEDDGWPSFTRSRLLRDIDFLVPAAQWSLAGRLLGEAGYRQTGEGPNTAAFNHPAGGVELDLHRAPHSLHEPMALPDFLTADGFWRHAETAAVRNLRWRRLGAAQSLLHGILHTEIADLNFAAGDWALRYLHETALLTRTLTQWPELGALESVVLRRAVNAHFFAAHRLFGGSLPPDFAANVAVRRHFVRCSLNARHPHSIRRVTILTHKLRQAMTPWYLTRIGLYRPGAGRGLMTARVFALAALLRRYLLKLPRLLFGGEDSGVPPPRV